MEPELAAVRPFRAEDETAVVEVWYRAGRAAYSFLPAWQGFTLELAGKVFREIIRPRCEIWVATRGEQIVGFLAIDGSYIERMYVDPSEWQRGFGTRFVELAKQRSPSGLQLHTHQQNHAARALYEKHGFVVVKLGVSPAPESVPDVEYRWQPR